MSCVPAPDPSVRWVEACPSAPVIEASWTHTAAILRIPCHCDAWNRIAELIGHHDDERRRQRRARGCRLIVTRAHRYGGRGAGRGCGCEGRRWRGLETGNGRRDCLSTGFAAQDPLSRRMPGGIRHRGVRRNGARSLVRRHEGHAHPGHGLCPDDPLRSRRVGLEAPGRQRRSARCRRSRPSRKDRRRSARRGHYPHSPGGPEGRGATDSVGAKMNAARLSASSARAAS